jgi:predicted nucleic acid-binding protein
MAFSDLPSGASVFLDANTLIYPFAPEPALGPPCAERRRRVESQDLLAFTAAHVLSEAIQRFGWPVRGIAQRLRQHPAQVQQLTVFCHTVELVLQSRVHVLATAPSVIANAAAVSQQTGLLSTDALVVAVMREHGLTHLASHDADFDCVPGLTRCSPA